MNIYFLLSSIPHRGVGGNRGSVSAPGRNWNARPGGIGALAKNRTSRTLGLPRKTDGPAVRLEQVAETDFHLIGDQRIQIKLNLIRVRLSGESEALGKTGYMGIHTDSGLAKDITQQDIGGFSAHSREGDEVRKLLRNPVAEPIDEGPTTPLDRPGLVPVKPGRTDLCLQCTGGRASPVTSIPVLLEERCGNLVDSLVRALGRQDQGDEKLKGALKVQGQTGAGVGPIQNLDYLLNPLLPLRGSFPTWRSGLLPPHYPFPPPTGLLLSFPLCEDFF